MAELLYTTHNRLEFTRTTFAALVENTDWTLVDHLHVCDDRSRDGSYEFLHEAIRAVPVSCSLTSSRFGGPVAAMVHAVGRCKSDTLVKVDNDLLLCPGWPRALLDVLEAAPELDVLGFEAGFGEALAPADASRTYREGPHVGGIAAFRTRIFKKHKPRQSGVGGRLGWTAFQRSYARCGWLVPDLACVALDRLPFEPWRSLSAAYVARGWQREWPKYPESMSDYWSWAFAGAVA
jgi:hypothetical protein